MIEGVQSGPLRLALLASVAALSLVAAAPAAKAGPLDSNGMWVWYVSASGGSGKAIAGKAVRRHVGTVFVKSGDAGNYWSQFSPALVGDLHRRGVDACAWQFVYGSNPVAEAKVGAKAVRNGADCLVIDAEGSYEGRYGAADAYIRKLRSLIGRDYPLALAGFPYVDYHPSFPYSVFLGRRGAQFNLPQMYWHTIGTSVHDIYTHTYRWNRPYARPIYPLGQTYANPGRREITAFRQYAREFEAPGTSWWSWQETQSAEWHWIGRRVHHGVPGFQPSVTYPGLQPGSRGDLVVLVQELLQAAGRSVHIDGYFGAHTEHALRRFQREHGLTETGHVHAPTWNALLELQPNWVSWSKRGAKARSEPRSASLHARGYEIPRALGSG
jgi:Putative peptidoglycan binding domain